MYVCVSVYVCVCIFVRAFVPTNTIIIEWQQVLVSLRPCSVAAVQKKYEQNDVYDDCDENEDDNYGDDDKVAEEKKMMRRRRISMMMMKRLKRKQRR